jgi:hypothetical protein
MPRRTVIRSLKRLEEDGWIEAKRQHRRPTIYNIRVERLADNWGAKVVESLGATVAPKNDFECHGGTQDATGLSATVAPKNDFECHGGTQDPVLSATVAPHPLYVLIPCTADHKEPALRAESPDDLNAKTPDAPSADEAKVGEAKDGPRVPHQLTFGPEDVSPRPARDPNWARRFADTIRDALHQAADRKQHG